MKHGVIWDMDGVLIDTADFHYRSWIEVLSDHGIEFPRPLFDRTFGMNNPALLRLLLGRVPEPELYTTISERKEALFLQLIQEDARPMPGVLTWLRRLQEAGYRQAIASSAPQANIEALIDAMGIRSYFAAMISGIDMPGKPEPDVFLETARRIETPPEHCVVFEDAAVGVEGAKRAGMKCIAVATTLPVHKLSKADIVVETLPELPVYAVFRLLGWSLPT